MEIKPIKTENDYNQALQRLEIIFDAKVGSPEGDELEVLGILIDKYENEKFPISLPDPIEAIKFRMEQMGLSSTDMVKYLGSQSRVSEILNKKRRLSLTMIKSLYKELKIPAEILLA